VQLGTPEEAAKIEAALKRQVAKAWQRQRLQAMQMAVRGQWTLQQIGDAVGAGRSTVAVWLKLLRTQGMAVLLQWKKGQGAPGKLTAPMQAAVQAGLATGRWRRACDLQLWLRKEHGIDMGLGGVYYYLGKAGGVLKVPRKTHAKKRRGSNKKEDAHPLLEALWIYQQHNVQNMELLAQLMKSAEPHTRIAANTVQHLWFNVTASTRGGIVTE